MTSHESMGYWLRRIRRGLSLEDLPPNPALRVALIQAIRPELDQMLEACARQPDADHQDHHALEDMSRTLSQFDVSTLRELQDLVQKGLACRCPLVTLPWMWIRLSLRGWADEGWLELFSHDNWHVRSSVAALALDHWGSRIAAREAVSQLAVSDPDPRVRRSAASGLGRFE